MPLAEAHPVRTKIGKNQGEGTQEEDEQGKAAKSAQTPPLDTIGASTQPPSTVVEQAPILTSAATAPMPPPTNISHITTMSPITQVLRPTT